MATQFSEYSVANSLFFEKKNSPKSDRELGFFGDGVATFMLTGYSFQSFLK
jgi:hypothetical protein